MFLLFLLFLWNIIAIPMGNIILDFSLFVNTFIDILYEKTLYFVL